MKRIYMASLFACVLIIIVGVAMAGEMRGDVSAVNSKTGSFTVKSEEKAVDFESEAGVLRSNVSVDDTVVVKFEEKNGKKKATKIIKVPKGC